MNQLLNKIPYGLLTEDEQAGFSTEMKDRGLYEVYDKTWHQAYKDYSFMNYRTYRLKILPEEWYFVKFSIVDEVRQGKEIHLPKDGSIKVLRPALPEEIPKPEPTLLERIEAAYEGKEVVLLEWDEEGMLSFSCKSYDANMCSHVLAQSMKGFDGFIYDWKGDDSPFTKIFPPVRLGCHPIAAVFNK